jgi:ubiquinone/menaquinone biosynthesis C-methylase UbiE
MSESQIRTIDRFFEMISQPAQTAALNAALRLGVVEALEQGQKTAAELAELCSLQPEGTGALLQILIQSGLVEQFDEHFALTQAARLTPRALWAITFEQWTGLETALRQPASGDSQAESELAAESDRRNRRKFDRFRVLHSQLQWAATGVALKLTEALGIGSERSGLQILDLGCGAAVYSMAIAHRDPATRVQLVDDRAGLARARATVDSLDAGDRAQMAESAELVFPGHNDTFDLVIVADQIHIWPPAMRQRLLATARRTLKPGGELAVVDVFSGQPRGEMNCSLFELQLLIGTGRGPVRLPDLSRQLETAGFSGIQYTHLPVVPFTHGLLLAARNDSA